jgi:hypothetical protein
MTSRLHCYFLAVYRGGSLDAIMLYVCLSDMVVDGGLAWPGCLDRASHELPHRDISHHSIHEKSTTTDDKSLLHPSNRKATKER